MNLKSILGKLLVVFFLIISFGLLLFDTLAFNAIERERLLEAKRTEAEAILEDILRFYSPEIQVKSLLESFHSRIAKIIDDDYPEKGYREISRIYKETLANLLPPHEISIIANGNEMGPPITVFQNSASLGFTPFCSDFFSRKIFGKPEKIDISGFLEKMRNAIHFPISEEFLDSTHSIGFHVFNSLKGNRGFFLGLFPPGPNKGPAVRTAFSALIDLENLPPDFGIKLILKTPRKAEAGIIFFQTNGGPGMFSPYFEKRTGLKNKIIDLFKGDPKVGEKLILDNHLIVFGQEITRLFLRPAVAIPLFPTSNGSREGNVPGEKISQGMQYTTSSYLLLAVLASFVFLGIFVFREKYLMRREFGISVGVLLLGAFLLVAILPLTGISGIARFIVGEEEKRSLQIGTRELHETLSLLDRGSLDKVAAHVDAIRKMINAPETGKNLFAEETLATDTGTVSLMAKEFRIYLPWKTGRSLAGILMVAGPNGFFRAWKQPNQGFSSVSNHIQNIVQPALKRAQSRSWKTEARNTAAKNSRRDRGDGGKEYEAEGIQFEIVKEMCIKLFGGDFLLDLIYSPSKLQTLKSNFGKLYILPISINFRGVPRYYSAWMWEDSYFTDCYLDYFEELYYPKKEGSFFFIYAGEQELKPKPRYLARNSNLYDLVLRAKDTGSSLQSSIKTSSGDFVLEAIQTTTLNNSLFAGMMKLKDFGGATRSRVNKLLFGAFFLALFLGAISTRYFMSPLRGILKTFRSLQPGKYDEEIPDSGRADEFGTLAQAFNSMLKGLREKDILGKYVSGSVRKMVRDPNFYKIAEEGTMREVSVLFVGLKGFEHFHDENSPERVVGLLDDYLSAVNEAVARHGGEVSKIIGEKIMIVFDPEDCGSPARAAMSAFEVIKSVGRGLTDFPLSLVYGLNSGPVIVGIIGSPKVRRDYTVIGDTVNLASRLAALAYTVGGSRAVISGASYRLLEGNAEAELLPFTKVKGKSKEVEAFLLKI